MFGKNPLMKKSNGDGSELHIVNGSPFRTIQGEGPYAGRPAVFLRLHGCNLACTFCDTDFSNPDDPVVELSEIMRRIKELFGKEKIKLVVITGGEPLRQNIGLLLLELSFIPQAIIQIETAGTLWPHDIYRPVEMVCSPKTPTIHPKVFDRAVAFKYVIDCEQELDGFIPITATQADARPARLAAPRPGAPVYLSPMDTYDSARNKENIKLVGKLALQYGVNAGLQMHKFFQVD